MVDAQRSSGRAQSAQGEGARTPTLAVLGGGQLGRMLALAATPLGVRVRTLSPDAAAPAAAVSEHICAAYDDEEALARLIAGADAVACEFEKVPAEAAAWIDEHRADLAAANCHPFAPGVDALQTAQDRLREKELFQRLGIATPRFEPTASEHDLAAAVRAVREGERGCIVKTRFGGYDGKGQWRLSASDDADAAAATITRDAGEHAGALIVEAIVPFEREVSVIAVRSRAGELGVYPIPSNEHEGGILRRSIAPAPGMGQGGPRWQAACDMVEAIAAELNYVGVVALELFELPGGALVANELAPRVHNSGHWTIEGCVCSQFENHVRAVLGLPLGECGFRPGVAAAGMVNCLGQMPPRARVLAARPSVHVHDYAKAPRPGRKLGHITAVGDTPAAVAAALSGKLVGDAER